MIPVSQIGQIAKHAGPELPLEHLKACHRRIEDRLAVLERVADHFSVNPTEALEALDRCFTFFESNGARHTADEEESVFPRILPRLGQTESALVEDLKQQHTAAEALYAELRSIEPVAEAEQFSKLVKQFCELYRAHIQAEDTMLIPAAAAVLALRDLSEISSEMRARRS
jgi:hemerythrin-like domain-containing protein